MKPIIGIILLFCVILNSYCQNQRSLDSLNTVIETSRQDSCICKAYLLLGSIYNDDGKLELAKKHALKSLKLARQITSLVRKKETSHLLSLIYQKENHYEEALEMRLLYIQVSDSMHMEEREKAAVRQHLIYEYGKKVAVDSVAHLKQNEVKDAQLAHQTAEIEARRIEQFALFGGLLLVAIFAGFMYNRFKIAQQQKKEIDIQRLEAHQQREIAEENKQLAQTQTSKAKQEMHNAVELKNEISEKNKEITDSIEYAAHIQNAILTSDRYWEKILPNHFIFFRPKDIVSGDFYWAFEYEYESEYESESEKGGTISASTKAMGRKKIWITADCTGHGVPGGFMSMLGNTLLNEIIIENEVHDPGTILDQLRIQIIKALSHDSSKDKGLEMKDGMDMTLCVLHDDNTLEYAGANNPLWVISSTPTLPVISDERIEDQESHSVQADHEKTTHADLLAAPVHGEVPLRPPAVGNDSNVAVSHTKSENGLYTVTEIKANKQPIGQFGDLLPFTTHKIKLSSGHTIYTFTDGFIDQFGGRRGKKFKSKAFRHLLLSIQSEPFENRNALIIQAFDKWKGDLEQVDDICVIGVMV